MVCVWRKDARGRTQETHAKDIIDADYKYSIVNLKLEAEAAYV